MSDQALTTKTEPVGAWQPQGCISCQKPAEYQETAFMGERMLPVSVRHCGDDHCQQHAENQALTLAALPKVQALAV